MKTVVKKVYILDGGALEVEGSVMVSLNNCGNRVVIPVQMFLLETTRGYVLIDTGNDHEVIKDAESTWGVALASAAVPIMEEINHPYEQLKLLGLNADDIKMVIYTHLHHDHCGGARFFPDSLHVVQKAEYRWAFRPDRFANLPYVDTDFNHANLNWQFAEGDWHILPGVHLISTPGHTPGHQSIALWDVPDVGSVILTGDATNCRDNIEMDVPGGITSDSASAMSSIHRLTALASVADASFIVSHDMGQFEMLPKIPNALERFTDDQKAFYKHGIQTVYADVADPANVI